MHSEECLFKFNIPPGVYLSKANNGNTKTLCKICPKLTMKGTYKNKIIKVLLLSLLLNLNRFHTLPWCFHCWSKCRLGWTLGSNLRMFCMNSNYLFLKLFLSERIYLHSSLLLIMERIRLIWSLLPIIPVTAIVVYWVVSFSKT